MMLFVSGCETSPPGTSRLTSGRLVVAVDEAYAPLFRALADSFMTRTPNAKVEIQAMNPRMAVQYLLDHYNDTTASFAAILGRRFLPDESAAMAKAGLQPRQYSIAYDGLAVVVPTASPLKQTTREYLAAALRSSAPTAQQLDSAGPSNPLGFVLPDQNSSAFALVRTLLSPDSIVKAPAHYVASPDSVNTLVADGKGIGIVGWYVAHRDSTRLRTLYVGYTDSLGRNHTPARVHPSSLVTDVYPLKQPIVGYTFADPKSVANGFLIAVSKGRESQRYIVEQGLQAENVKLQLVPAAAEE
ncbi:MAG: substrate-binding domain-containing protein [Armatimonadetes bacterium]|nr:substrate-binding domain-containing protein [Armatimonadota bacterium]